MKRKFMALSEGHFFDEVIFKTTILTSVKSVKLVVRRVAAGFFSGVYECQFLYINLRMFKY